METVKFQCSKCRNLMAVGADLLGKQVRCPHCQQIMLTPAQAPSLSGVVPPPAPVGGLAPVAASSAGAAAPGEVVFQVPQQRRDEEGSIFGEVEDGDDVFAGAQKTMEVPPAPASAADLSAWPTAANSPSGIDSGMGSSGHGASAPASSPAAGLPRPPAPAEKRGMLYLVVFLVPFSVIMTVTVVILLLLRSAKPPLEDTLLPKPGSSLNRTDDRKELPDGAILALNETRRFGDLEVTPVAVTRRKVTYAYESSNRNPEPSQKDALVITLHVKNVSTQWVFGPNDLVFNRKFKESDPNNYPKGNKPYTCLVVNGQRFYGGPCDYQPRVNQSNNFRQKGGPREYIKGTEYSKDLHPGQEMDMIVCTDPDDAAILAAVDAAETLLWRIQLRRGVMEINSSVGTVTTVIGVKFTRDQITNPS